ncbi:cysteine--tRNA ligase, partial [bacterium]|nr:cysteine--tRNA ligase [bacterium]
MALELQFYNSLSRKKEVFKPIIPGEAKVYSCGPTVYSRQHIGNLRAAIFADILKRTLRYAGYAVTDVVNITDVGHLVSDETDEGEDKMEKAVRLEGGDPYTIARKYEELYRGDLARLNIIPPKFMPRATEHIGEQIKFIEVLHEQGYTYRTADGLYFDTSRFHDYGMLSGQKQKEKLPGARVSVNKEKRNPADFALWKFLTGENKEHIMRWNSPWGVGFPGWHIECSAMSYKYLGSMFDIHTGGIDHIPVHHENEIAQNACSEFIQKVSFWMHNNHLLLNEGKISKSIGNVIDLDEIAERGLAPLSFRYLILTAHYRSSLNFTWNAQVAASHALMRIYNSIIDIRGGSDADIPDEAYRQKFTECIFDDLDTAGALAVMWDLAKEGSLPPGVKRATFFDFDRILGLDFRGVLAKRAAMLLPEEVKTLLEKRAFYRANKDFKKADEIRAKIAAKG